MTHELKHLAKEVRASQPYTKCFYDAAIALADVADKHECGDEWKRGYEDANYDAKICTECNAAGSWAVNDDTRMCGQCAGERVAAAIKEQERLAADNAEMHVAHESMTLEVDEARAEAARLREACQHGAAASADRFTGFAIESNNKELLLAIQRGIVACRDALSVAQKGPIASVRNDGDSGNGGPTP